MKNLDHSPHRTSRSKKKIFFAPCNTIGYSGLFFFVFVKCSTPRYMYYVFSAGVGKTSLILSLVSEEFPEEVCLLIQSNDKFLYM